MHNLESLIITRATIKSISCNENDEDMDLEMTVSVIITLCDKNYEDIDRNVNQCHRQNKNWMLFCSLFCKQNLNGSIHLEKNNIHEDIFMYEDIQAHVEPQPKQSAATKDCHLDFL